ncbi:hypothetical protein [Winogradskyella sp.]|uniref:hypothetical protein n=1 Tax=Winogradskyella sp. TaxID=1883156 RepID=UPI003F6CB560
MRVNDILQRIQNAKDLDFGDLFNRSIELFKKVWVQGLVTLLLNMVLAIPVMLLIYIPLIAMGVMDGYMSIYNSYDPYGSYSQPDVSPVMLIVMLVLYLIAIAAMSTIAFGLKAAFYRICKMKDLEQMGKEDYFYFFKKPYLQKTITIALAYIGISILATLLCVIPIIYVFVPLSYMIVIYAFNPELSISEIIKLSFDLGNKKWLITFGILIVAGFLAGIVGMLMCFVGIYVTASFSYLPPYLIYKDVVGFTDNDENLQIEENATV